MASESKSFPQPFESALPALAFPRTQLEIGLAFAAILGCVWTAQGHLNTFLVFSTAGLIALLSLFGRFSSSQMGLGVPAARSVGVIVLVGSVLLLSLVIFAHATGWNVRPQTLQWRQIWKYSLWAVMQQFILLSFFFLRFESLLGGRRAVWWTAFLFAVVHIPSPFLTAASMLGGLFFCEMFRRYRTIWPLGVMHACLGCTIASEYSDAILRHMRVGIAFLRFHP